MAPPTFQKTHSITLIASAVVSAHRFISRTGAHCSDATQLAGVSEQAAAMDKALSVITFYSALVEAGEAISQGVTVGVAPDGSGRAVNGVGAGWALGSASAAGQLFEVVLASSGGGAIPVDPSTGAILATVIPRTNTLAALKALMTGGGELASATDMPCIVQLNGTPGSGIVAVYSPMGPGFWSDSVGARGDQQLQAKTGTGAANQAGAGRHLILSGGPGSPTGVSKYGGDVILHGGPEGTPGSGCGNVRLQAAGSSGGAGLATADGNLVFYIDGAQDLLMASNLPTEDPGVPDALYLHDIGGGIKVIAVSQVTFG